MFTEAKAKPAAAGISPEGEVNISLFKQPIESGQYPGALDSRGQLQPFSLSTVTRDSNALTVMLPALLPTPSPASSPLMDWKIHEKFASHAALRLYLLSHLSQHPLLRQLHVTVEDAKQPDAKTSLTLSGHTGGVRALTVLPDGRLASGSWDNTVKVWNVARGRCDTTLSGHAYGVNALAVLSDGRLASGSYGNTVKVWNVARDRCDTTLSGHTNGVRALTALPDGRLASGSEDETVKVWNVARGQCDATLSGHTDYVRALTILPNGRLASGSYDGTIKVWNVVRNQCEVTLSGHTKGVFALTALPDGRLASGSEDKTIKVWNVARGQCEATLSGHTAYVRALTILPDGRLASGSNDQTIKVWNVARSQCDATLSGHTGVVFALVVLPDGRLASGSFDNTVRLWALTTPTLALSVDFTFQVPLRQAYLSLSALEDGVVLILSQPVKAALTHCVKALQTLYPAVTFKTTVTDQHLQINGLDSATRDEVIKLLRAFITTPAKVAGHPASLLGAARSAAPVAAALPVKGIAVAVKAGK